MDTAQDKMLREYASLGQKNIVPSFKQKLRSAMEQGVLLFAKYALLAILLYVSLQFLNGLVTGSQNGTQSAIYLNELISKGYLPKAGPNGIEPKVETPVAVK